MLVLDFYCVCIFRLQLEKREFHQQIWCKVYDIKSSFGIHNYMYLLEYYNLSTYNTSAWKVLNYLYNIDICNLSINKMWLKFITRAAKHYWLCNLPTFIFFFSKIFSHLRDFTHYSRLIQDMQQLLCEGSYKNSSSIH